MKKTARGFSLIELLIAVAIIAILTAIGIAVFGSLAGNARDARRRADIDAMAKAYESNYDWETGKYVTLEDIHFTSKKKPTSPEGGSYYNNLATGEKSFTVCAKLEGHPASTACEATSATCYCQSSSLGSTVAVAPGAGGGGGSGACITVPGLALASGIACKAPPKFTNNSTVYVNCPSSNSDLESVLNNCGNTLVSCNDVTTTIYSQALGGESLFKDIEGNAMSEYIGTVNCASDLPNDITVKLHTP